MSRTAIYALGAGAAVGVALGSMNRARHKRAEKEHAKVTIDDLEKGG